MTTSTTGPATETAAPPTAQPPALSATAVDVPESLGYRVKRKMLGKPLVNDAAAHGEAVQADRPRHHGASTCISSSAYGSEQMLTQLLPYFGLLAFMLVMPITGVILGAAGRC